MNPSIKINAVLLLTTLSIAGCSSTESQPEPQRDPYNQADSQRSRATQAQDDLSSETSR